MIVKYRKEITGNTIIFKRVILRDYFYEQFP